LPIGGSFEKAHETERRREPKDGAFVKLGALRQSGERESLSRIVKTFEDEKCALG
jgi:hypothetical protein